MQFRKSKAEKGKKRKATFRQSYNLMHQELSFPEKCSADEGSPVSKGGRPKAAAKGNPRNPRSECGGASRHLLTDVTFNQFGRGSAKGFVLMTVL